MTAGHAFWFLLTAACLLWYGTITFVVAWKGFADILTMLRRLSSSERAPGGSLEDRSP